MTVPADMPREVPCPIAFVAEAPGAEEVDKGRPLVGPSGRVFNTGLRRANIDRSTCYVGNVFDEKAPDNDVGPWLRNEAKFDKACDRLEQELEKAQPNVIVPLGASALRAFTGHQKISSFRGAVMEAEYIRPGAKLLPTFHPENIMRQWNLLSLMVGDFVKAVREAEKGPEIVVPKRELWVEPDMDEILKFMPRCYESDLLSVDIETGWGCITCIGFAPNAYEAMCVPFVDRRRPNKSYWSHPEDEHHVWHLIKDLLEDASIPKLGQNFPYDLDWLYSYGLEVRNYLHDTRLLHHALYPELPKSLGSMTATYTDLPSWKHWNKSEEKRDA